MKTEEDRVNEQQARELMESQENETLTAKTETRVETLFGFLFETRPRPRPSQVFIETETFQNTS